MLLIKRFQNAGDRRKFGLLAPKVRPRQFEAIAPMSDAIVALSRDRFNGRSQIILANDKSQSQNANNNTNIALFLNFLIPEKLPFFLLRRGRRKGKGKALKRVSAKKVKAEGHQPRFSTNG